MARKPDSYFYGGKTCQHCRHKKVTRPGGLCWKCYYAPGVRQRYTGGAAAGYGLGQANHGRPAAILAGPGTLAKIKALSERAKACQPLHDAADAGWEANAGIDVDVVKCGHRRRMKK